LLIIGAQLSVYAKEEQLSVIQFLWSENVSGAAIHQRLSAQYRNSVLPQRSVYKWIEKLKNSHTVVMHNKGATATRGKCARDMILLDRQVAIDKVAKHPQISHGFVYEIMCNRLGFHKVSAR
jgi:hypothetical protein